MRSAYKPLVFASILMLMLLTVPMSTVVSTGSQPVDPAVTSCESAVNATYEAMNSTGAIQNAIHSQEYAQSVEGSQNGTYKSIFQIDQAVAPYPTCAEEVLSINVVFALINRTGGWRANLVISEGPNLAVTGSSVQTGGKHVNQFPYWSGMQVEANSGATQPIYGAYTVFTQEAAQYPNTGGCGTAGTCNFSPWVGIADATYGSSGHLAQDGTDAYCKVVSGSTCASTSYDVWYELVPGSITYCTGIAVSAGQNIFVKTLNEAQYQGSNSKYDFYIYDYGNADSCISNGNSFQMTSPKYGDFIIENADYIVNNGYEPLAAFQNVPFGNSVYGSSIYTAGSWSTIDHFFWQAIDMENAPGIWPLCGSYIVNVDYGNGLSSGGLFTLHFDSNQYTPYFQTDC